MGRVGKACYQLLVADVADVFIDQIPRLGIAVSQYCVGRQLIENTRVEVEGQLRQQVVRGRKAGRELPEWIIHFTGKIISIHARAQREGEPIVKKALAGLRKRAVF